MVLVIFLAAEVEAAVAVVAVIMLFILVAMLPFARLLRRLPQG